MCTARLPGRGCRCSPSRTGLAASEPLPPRSAPQTSSSLSLRSDCWKCPRQAVEMGRERSHPTRPPAEGPKSVYRIIVPSTNGAYPARGQHASTTNFKGPGCSAKHSNAASLNVCMWQKNFKVIVPFTHMIHSNTQLSYRHVLTLLLYFVVHIEEQCYKTVRHLCRT